MPTTSLEKNGPRPTPPSRDAFRCFRPLQTRWSDNDVYGHMNNVVHYALFDTAINGWLIENRLLDIHKGDIVGLVVRTECHYFSEMAFPEPVTAGIRIDRLGTSSVAYAIALFRGEERQAAAEGAFVHVYVDRATRRPRPVPDAWRNVMEAIAA